MTYKLHCWLRFRRHTWSPLSPYYTHYDVHYIQCRECGLIAFAKWA